MSSFYEKRQARIDRLLSRAEKHQTIAEQNSISKIYGEENSGIPLGQPILVGHHSERRHRKQLERMDNRARKGFEAGKYAEELKERAEAAASNTAIFSDDPEARDKILNKIAQIEKTQSFMKAANKIVRSKKLSHEEKCEQLRKMSEGTNIKNIEKILQPDFMGRVGFETYRLSSLSAEKKRLNDRLLDLEKKAAYTDYQLNGVDVLFRDGQVQVHFRFKPSEAVRSKLKRSPLALKWSRYSEAWVRKLTAGVGDYFFQELNKVLNEVTQ